MPIYKSIEYNESFNTTKVYFTPYIPLNISNVQGAMS